MILFVIANLAKVVSFFRRKLRLREQARNEPQKPVTPSEALARATQSANRQGGIAIPLSTIQASFLGQGARSSAPAAEESRSTTVNIDILPVLLAPEPEELPIYVRGSEVGDCPERVVILPSESTTVEELPPSYISSCPEHGQSETA